MTSGRRYRRRPKIGTGLPAPAECRDCHDPIRFVRMTQTGRRLPVNPMPSPMGLVAAYLTAGELRGHVISKVNPATAQHAYRFRAHAATCTDRPNNQPKPSPGPALF